MYFFINWLLWYRTSGLGTAIHKCPSLQNRKSYRPNRKSLVMQKVTFFIPNMQGRLHTCAYSGDSSSVNGGNATSFKREKRCIAAACGRDNILPAPQKQAQLPHIGVWEPSCCAVTWNNTRKMNVWCWLMTGGCHSSFIARND